MAAKPQASDSNASHTQSHFDPRAQPAGTQNSPASKTPENEARLGPGSELDAIPPDAKRDSLPPDASVPGKAD